MRDDDLSPREKASRNLSEASGWDLAESENRIDAGDVFDRLARMSLSAFGANKEEWSMAFDEEGFLTALTAEGKRVDGGLTIRVWPNDHPPPHVHILKKGEADSLSVKLDLGSGEVIGKLPPWVKPSQLKRMKALIRSHQSELSAWWERYHGGPFDIL